MQTELLKNVNKYFKNDYNLSLVLYDTDNDSVNIVEDKYISLNFTPSSKKRVFLGQNEDVFKHEAILSINIFAKNKIDLLYLFEEINKLDEKTFYNVNYSCVVKSYDISKSDNASFYVSKISFIICYKK